MRLRFRTIATGRFRMQVFRNCGEDLLSFPAIPDAKTTRNKGRLPFIRATQKSNIGELHLLRATLGYSKTQTARHSSKIHHELWRREATVDSTCRNSTSLSREASRISIPEYSQTVGLQKEDKVNSPGSGTETDMDFDNYGAADQNYIHIDTLSYSRYRKGLGRSKRSPPSNCYTRCTG